MDAGKLNERIAILYYISGEWKETACIWGSAAQSDRNNLFSTVGIGARSAEFIIRKRDVTLHNAFRWRGMHCFLTSIVDHGKRYLKVTAAIIEPKNCAAWRGEISYNERRNPVKTQQKLFDFKACVTEKYMGYIQQQPQTQIKETLVLVTPKIVELKMGDLVDIEGRGRYYITLPHITDEYKNEYEVQRIKES